MPTCATKSLGACPGFAQQAGHLWQRLAVQKEGPCSHRDEQRAEQNAQQKVVAGGPDEQRVRHEAIGLVDRHCLRQRQGQRADDAGHETDVVERVALVGLEQAGGGRHQHEAHHQ